jgi:putative transcriptional regulator
MREWLIFARRRKDLSQGEVANQAAISRAFYAQLESGVRSPSPIVAKRVAGVLDFTWTVFYEDKGQVGHGPYAIKEA